jgi:hypothetical protein
VLASIVAYVWIEEALGVGQIVGGVLVLLGVAIAQTARRGTRADAPNAP